MRPHLKPQYRFGKTSQPRSGDRQKNPNGIQIIQPRVVEPARLPWVSPKLFSTPMGLHQFAGRFNAHTDVEAPPGAAYSARQETTLAKPNNRALNRPCTRTGKQNGFGLMDWVSLRELTAEETARHL